MFSRCKTVGILTKTRLLDDASPHSVVTSNCMLEHGDDRTFYVDVVTLRSAVISAHAQVTTRTLHTHTYILW